MRIESIVLMILLAVLVAGQSMAAEQSKRFVQDRFVISFWVDPPVDQLADIRYKELADAGFTLVTAVFGPQNDKDTMKVLDLCKKYGLKAIIKGDLNTPDKLIDHPSCWGYYMVDEPSTKMIPEIRDAVAAVHRARPGKLLYFNLFPAYATSGATGAPTYDEYIGRFAKETDCDFLCMDHYPRMTPTDDGRDGYCADLAVMRKYSMERGIPFWNFFNVMPYGSQYDPTESQLRWQIYTSLAYGAKGVLYFCYWTPTGYEFPKGGAIITPDGRKTRHYDQAKRINTALKNLGPTLMKLTSTDIIRVKPGDKSSELLKGSPVRSISEGDDYLIGVFKHADGRRAVLINNYDYNYTTWPTVEFDVPFSDVVEVSPVDGKEMPVRDESPDTHGLQLSFDSGEGRLFLLPAK